MLDELSTIGIAKDLLYVDLNDGKTMIEVSEIAATDGYLIIDIT